MTASRPTRRSFAASLAVAALCAAVFSPPAFARGGVDAGARPGATGREAKPPTHGEYAPSGVTGMEESAPRAATGRVVVCGNEPFTWTGFVPEGSRLALYVTPREAARDLVAAQGYRVEVVYAELRDPNPPPAGFGDGAIRVISWKIVK